MNDVEKKFRELLRHHEVTPPPAVWDQLSANLAQKRKRKAVAYWRVAAAVALLLLGTGTLIMLLRSEPARESVAQRERPSAIDSEAPSVALTDQKKAIDPVRTPAPSGEEPEASTALAGVAPVVKEDKYAPEEQRPGNASVSQPQDSPAQLPTVLPTPQPERLRVAALQSTVPEAADNSMPADPVHKVALAAVSKSDRSAPNELASAPPPAAVAQRRTVTVTYKPGNRSLDTPSHDQDGGLLSKTLSFLEDVKKNGPTYSELRSAKSALIDNVFSRDPDKEQ